MKFELFFIGIGILLTLIYQATRERVINDDSWNEILNKKKSYMEGYRLKMKHQADTSSSSSSEEHHKKSPERETATKTSEMNEKQSAMGSYDPTDSQLVNAAIQSKENGDNNQGDTIGSQDYTDNKPVNAAIQPNGDNNGGSTMGSYDDTDSKLVNGAIQSNSDSYQGGFMEMGGGVKEISIFDSDSPSDPPPKQESFIITHTDNSGTQVISLPSSSNLGTNSQESSIGTQSGYARSQVVNLSSDLSGKGGRTDCLREAKSLEQNFRQIASMTTMMQTQQTAIVKRSTTRLLNDGCLKKINLVKRGKLMGANYDVIQQDEVVGRVFLPR